MKTKMKRLVTVQRIQKAVSETLKMDDDDDNEDEDGNDDDDDGNQGYV